MLKQFVIADSERYRDEIMQALDAAEFVAFDIETSGLNPRKDNVIGFAICTEPGKAWYLPLQSWDGKQLTISTVEVMYFDVLTVLQNKKLLMHNGSFDTRFIIEQHGTDLVPALYCDTMLLKHTVDEERPFGLKDIAKKIQHELGLDVTKEANAEQVELQEHLKAKGASLTKENYELFKGDYEIIGKYACADVDLTYRVFNCYSKQLEEQGLVDFFYKDEVMPLYKEVTIPMELYGIPFDAATCAKYREELGKDLAELEKKILTVIDPHLAPFKKWFLNKDYPPSRSGSFAQSAAQYFKADLPKTKSGNYSMAEKAINALPTCRFKNWYLGYLRLDPEEIVEIQKLMHGDQPMFNISSKHHLKKLFFDILKLAPTTKTEKGNPQVNDKFLEKAAQSLDWVKDLILYNRLSKLKGSYYDRFYTQQEDGVFYPRFQQHRTISGRYGSDIQQLPRPTYEDHPLIEKYQNQIRKLFIAGESHKFVDADYQAIEPRAFAHVSGDKNLQDIFHKGHDFYSTIAIRTERLDQYSADPSASNFLKKVAPVKRQNAKTYALGIPYGMSAYKLKFEIGVSEPEAKKLYNDYLNSFKSLEHWMIRSEEKCIKEGWVQSEAGRIRHMPRAVEIYNTYGQAILNDLELWKEWNEKPISYAKAKEARRELKNLLNNSKNFQIQSLAASIVSRAAIAINRYMLENNINGRICCQIHDQLLIRVVSDQADHMRIKMQEIMETVYPISVPLPAPASIADNFMDGH